MLVSPQLTRHGATAQSRQSQVQNEGARLSTLNQPQRIDTVLDAHNRVPGRAQSRAVQLAKGGIVFNDQDIPLPGRLRHAKL